MLAWARANLRRRLAQLARAPRVAMLVSRVARLERTMLVGVILGAAALFAFAKLADEVGEGSTRGFDERLLLALRAAGDPADPIGPKWFEEMARDVTALGSTGVLTLMVLSVAGFLAMTRKSQAALFVLASVIGGTLLSQTMKFVYARPRPDLVPHGAEVYTASFPSGHSMMSAIAYLTLGALLARTQPDRGVKVYILTIAMVLTVLVGSSRVYLGVHWPTDVLAGWALGGVWALLCWTAMMWLQSRGHVEDDGRHVVPGGRLAYRKQKSGRREEASMRVCLRALLIVMSATAASTVAAQDKSEKLTFPQDHRGKPITVGGDLFLPAGTAKVPALVIHHGSGGVSADRELRYAREIVKMGVATFVIDSFKPRGITSTVQDQSAVTSLEKLGDAFGALKVLAGHPRVDGKRVGIIGFSKGGEVALQSALEVRVTRYSPEGLRFALHVPFYPWCGTQHYKPKTTGAPIYMLLGAADTYVGVEPCKTYADVLKAEGARIETVIYPGAKHGFDGGQEYTVAQGQNSSRCVYQQQADGTWKERTSGITTADSKGQILKEPARQAVEKCRTLGVSGGPNEGARAKSMEALKGYVRLHLVDGK